MKNDKKWLKESINGNSSVTSSDLVWRKDGEYWKNENIVINKGNLFYLIDQLDPPELTEEQAWKKIAEHYPGSPIGMKNSFEHFYYGGHLEKKPEKPVIPQFVAEWLQEWKTKEGPSLQRSMMRAFNHLNYTLSGDENDVANWVIRNQETFARAWLDGYEVADEPHYYVAFEGEFNLLYVTHVDIYGENGKVNYNSESDKNRAMKFTDKSRAKYLADFLGAIVVEVTE